VISGEKPIAPNIVLDEQPIAKIMITLDSPFVVKKVLEDKKPRLIKMED
jgi:hypothetical protein